MGDLLGTSIPATPLGCMLPAAPTETSGQVWKGSECTQNTLTHFVNQCLHCLSPPTGCWPTQLVLGVWAPVSEPFTLGLISLPLMFHLSDTLSQPEILTVSLPLVLLYVGKN